MKNQSLKGISNMKAVRNGLLAAALLMVTVIGCSGGKSESRSMEEIYAEEGVPVRVDVVQPSQFVKELEFTSVLTGIEESSAYAKVSDRVDEITASVGDYVKKDSVIVTFPTDNPKANYYQAKVQFENAAANYARMKEYFESGGLSQQGFDNAEASYRVAEANWNAVRQSVLVLAPISGVITRLNVRESDNVNDEDELFTVSRTDRLKAHVWVPDTDIEQVAVGEEARAEWQGQELTGRVVQVDRSVNRMRQAFGVVVELDNPDGKVQSGVTANITIATYASDSAIVTARKNISSDNKGSYVFVVKDNTAEMRRVTVGGSHLMDVEIVDGLSFGDSLVVEGQLHLKHGALVKIIDESWKDNPETAANM